MIIKIFDASFNQSSVARWAVQGFIILYYGSYHVMGPRFPPEQQCQRCNSGGSGMPNQVRDTMELRLWG